MREYGLTYEEALKHARQGRSCIWPNSGFVEQLNIWKACDFDILNKHGKEKLAYVQVKARLAEAQITRPICCHAPQVISGQTQDLVGSPRRPMVFIHRRLMVLRMENSMVASLERSRMVWSCLLDLAVDCTLTGTV